MNRLGKTHFSGKSDGKITQPIFLRFLVFLLLFPGFRGARWLSGRQITTGHAWWSITPALFKKEGVKKQPPQSSLLSGEGTYLCPSVFVCGSKRFSVTSGGSPYFLLSSFEFVFINLLIETEYGQYGNHFAVFPYHVNNPIAFKYFDANIGENIIA